MATESTVTTSTPAETGEASTIVTDAGTQSNTQVDAAQSTQEQAAPVTTDVNVAKKPAPTAEELAALSASEKFNVNDMIIKQLRGEEFTEADIAKLEKAGLGVDQIGLLAEAHKTLQLKNNAEIHEAVGGEQTYQGMKEFAAENLNDDEIDAYNSALHSGNMRLAKMAALGLKALMEAENGKPPAMRIAADGDTKQVSGAYATQAELIKDLNNRKYGKDPEFTAQVDARRNKSGF